MQHSIELAVLDISGTTVKDKGEITEAFAKTFEAEGYKIPEDYIIDSLQELPALL